MTTKTNNNKNPLYNKLSDLLMPDDFRAWKPETPMYEQLDIKKGY